MTGILIKSAILLGVGLGCGPVLAQTEQPAQGQATECPPGAECPQSQGGEQGQQPDAQSGATGQGEDQGGQQTETTTGEQPAVDQGATDQTKQGAATSETEQQKQEADTSQSGAEQKPAEGEQPAQGGTEQTDTQQTQQDSSTKADVTVEQKTEITQIIREEKVEPVEVDIDLSVGVVVPQTVKVKLKPLPARIVKIVPQYEGYLFFILTDGRIVIVEPSTLKVVVILA